MDESQNPGYFAVEVVVMKHVMVVGLVIGALFLSACGGRQPAQQQPAAQQPAAPAAEGQTVKVDMSEFEFTITPSELTAGKVTFELVNVGAVEHSFVIEGTDVKSEQIRAGQTVTVQVDLAPGTYTAICDVAGHRQAGMTVELVVK